MEGKGPFDDYSFYTPTAAARAMGISKATMYKRMAAHPWLKRRNPYTGKTELAGDALNELYSGALGAPGQEALRRRLLALREGLAQAQEVVSAAHDALGRLGGGDVHGDFIGFCRLVGWDALGLERMLAEGLLSPETLYRRQKELGPSMTRDGFIGAYGKFLPGLVLGDDGRLGIAGVGTGTDTG